MTIHKCDPLRYDPWYLEANSEVKVVSNTVNRSLGNMGGIQLRKNLNLLLDILNLVLRTLKIDDLDGHGLLRALVIPGHPFTRTQGVKR
jgi:hypothetical protein